MPIGTENPNLKISKKKQAAQQQTILVNYDILFFLNMGSKHKIMAEFDKIIVIRECHFRVY